MPAELFSNTCAPASVVTVNSIRPVPLDPAGQVTLALRALAPPGAMGPSGFPVQVRGGPGTGAGGLGFGLLGAAAVFAVETVEVAVVVLTVVVLVSVVVVTLVWVREEGSELAARAVRACVPDAQVIAMLPDADGVRVE